MKKKKTVKKKREIGTRLLGQVNLYYVQFGIPKDMVEPTAEALSQLILGDYYKRFYSPKIEEN